MREFRLAGRLRASAAIVAVGLGVWAGPALADAEPAAVPGGFASGSAAESANPGGSLPGVNDWDCVPSDAHPRPVVLVHGLGLNGQSNWAGMAPALKAEGYCLFAPTYGVLPAATTPPLNAIGGLASMYDSAAQVGDFVAEVRAATSADKVDLVTHSEGTLVGGYYVKLLGGADVVENYVALTPVWKGNEAYGAGVALQVTDRLGITDQVLEGWEPIGPAVMQMAKGSAFMNEITDGGPYAPGVRYTNVMTRYDELVMPYTAGHVEGPNARNIVLQDDCEQDFSEHLAAASSVRSQRIVLNALDPAHAQPVPCVFVPPVFG